MSTPSASPIQKAVPVTPGFGGTTPAASPVASSPSPSPGLIGKEV